MTTKRRHTSLPPEDMRAAILAHHSRSGNREVTAYAFGIGADRVGLLVRTARAAAAQGERQREAGPAGGE